MTLLETLALLTFMLGLLSLIVDVVRVRFFQCKYIISDIFL